MKPTDIVEFKKKHKLSSAELARTIGVHPAQITRWEKGTQGIPDWLVKLLDCLQRTWSEET
jgi:DNA-binding transcriptional regulator YiaG